MSPTNGLVVSRHGLSSTIAWGRPNAIQYALEGNITNTGGTVDWIAGFLGLEGAHQVAALAATVPDSGGISLVPAFAGLGAPHWDPEARGLVCGLTRGSTSAHVARAALESIAFQITDVLEAMRNDTGLPLPELLVDGGASSNDALMQFQADIAGCNVVRSSSPDLSLRGAAWLAGLAIGFWESPEELKSIAGRGDRFVPAMPESRRQELLDGWRIAVSRAVSGRTRPTSRTVSDERVA
jgi:glycerol kinase